MSRVISGLVAILLWSSAAAAQAPPIPPPPGFLRRPSRDATKTGTAVIRGHVFDAGSGRPLRKAQVRVFAPELRENRLTTTDADGAYEIKDLAAGRYQLNASKGSFVQLQYGQPRPFEPGKPLEVANGQTHREGRFQPAARRHHHGPHPGRVRRPGLRRPGDGDALPVHPGPAPADAGWPRGHDQRHRRVPPVRAASGAVLRIGHVSRQLQFRRGVRRSIRLRADVLPERREHRRRPAHHRLASARPSATSTSRCRRRASRASPARPWTPKASRSPAARSS